jgi:predicted permease
MRRTHWFYTLPLRLRSLFRRRQVEQELDEELRYHIERQIEEHISKGMTEEEARSAALRAIGGVEQRKEECRDMRRVRWIEDLVQDLRYSVRTLCKSPGFTTVAVLSLALGIGVNTAIFSLVDPIVIKTLPVKNPEQLVVLSSDGQYPGLPYSMVEQLRTRTQVFTGVSFSDAEMSIDLVDPVAGDQMETARLQLVSGEYFQVLGVNAVLGRTLTSADNQAPCPTPLAVLSYRYWQSRFAGDLSIIGKAITLRNQPFTIIGVTTPEFFGDEVGRTPDIWAPLLLTNSVRTGQPCSGDNGIGFNRPLMARLRPGVSEEQAQAALDLFWGQLATEPTTGLGRWANRFSKMGFISKIKMSPGQRGFTYRSRGDQGLRSWIVQPLQILMAVVGLVLIIACANVANLLLTRVAVRQKEVAIRLTIGAGRFRLIRQFLTESALLAAAGGVMGMFFAWWGSRLLLVLMSRGTDPIPIDVTPNIRILGFTIIVSLLTVFLFGLAPALIATRQDLNAMLKASTAQLLPRSRLSLSRSLVIAQVALSVLLLTGAGLIIQTLHNLRTMDFGFATEHIIQARVSAEEAGYKGNQVTELKQRILERLSSAPGVRSAATAINGFLSGASTTCCIAIEGLALRPDEDRKIDVDNVRPGYFHTLGLPLLLGRDFTAQDLSREAAAGPRAAIINETMARKYFGTANPLGKRFGMQIPGQSNINYNREIVGVVKDSPYWKIRAEIPPLIYYPSREGDLFVVRAEGRADSLVATIRREIEAVDKKLKASDIYTASQAIDKGLFSEILLARLSSFFALLALLLACVGLYGVLSYDVARRTHEIGIRMALGAQRRDVVGLVMRETLLLVVIGIIIGLGAALGATRLIASLLYGLTPNDPLTIALASLLLLTVASLAGYLPARRAARVDPMVALRHD